MPQKDVSSIDQKGRILIPQSIRDALNIKEGQKVILELDKEGKSVKIEPAHEKKLLKLEILLADSPGALAAAASVLAKLGVDLVSTESHSTKRGEAATWEVECNPLKVAVSELKPALSKVGAKLLAVKWD